MHPSAKVKTEIGIKIQRIQISLGKWTESVLDCLDATSPKFGKVVFHNFEFFRSVPFSICDLANDANRILGAV
jgi:hypothetical protein